MKYRVLWIDDNPESNEGFEDFAYLYDIELDHYYTRKEGMTALEKDIHNFHAVILDGLVWDESKDEAPSTIGLQNALLNLERLRSIRAVPHFIYSGYLGSKKYQQVREMLGSNQVFTKGKDNELLIQAIVSACEEQSVFQLEKRYPDLFEFCSDRYIGKKHLNRVAQIISDMESVNFIHNQQDSLNPMRKVIEASFNKLHELKLIPAKIFTGDGSINGSSIFLSGRHKQYKIRDGLVHPAVSESLRFVLSFTQDASHNNGSRLLADNYLQNCKNNLLYKSLCYSFVEILNNMKELMDNLSTMDTSVVLWQEVIPDNSNYLKGKIIRVADNGWGTFQSFDSKTNISIHPNVIEKNQIKEKSQITIKTKPSDCGTKTYLDSIISIDVQ